MCLYPKLLKNKKYTYTKKNKGAVPHLKDERVKYIPVGCGKCIECLNKKARDWKIRLQEEIRTNSEGKFVTLTFSEESINKLLPKLNTKKLEYVDNELATYAVRKFLENWRKEYGKSVKHWLITELGHKNTERIHLHGIIFGDTEIIIRKWKYGWVYIGAYVNNITINYIVKYVTKIDNIHKWFTPKILCSPGIGANYINRPDVGINEFNGEKTNELYTTKNGTKLPIPSYYRNKIYNEEERELLWINKLNKEERYVCGEKIKTDTPEGQKQYEELRDYYREKNIRLGYGDGNKDWDQKFYDRTLQYIKRLTKENQKHDKNHLIIKKEKPTSPDEGITPNKDFG